MTGTPVTIVLLHGAGHTSSVWASVQSHLRHPSVAVDLPGRRDRSGDITSVTIDDASRSVAADVVAATNDRVVLVGHSAAGIVLPALAARLGGRVEHLVFVAGLCAVEGGAAVDVFRPGSLDDLRAHLAGLRERYRGHMLTPEGDLAAGPAIDDVELAMSIDSLNYITQAVSWAGVPPGVERTWVRSLRDPIQPRDVQVRLAATCAAATVVDIDAGHTAALDAPAELAAILDRVADRHDAAG